jgi:hypothetical protein
MCERDQLVLPLIEGVGPLHQFKIIRRSVGNAIEGTIL